MWSPQENIKYSKKYHNFYQSRKKYMVFLTIIEKYVVFLIIFHISLRGKICCIAISVRKMYYNIIILDLTI